MWLSISVPHMPAVTPRLRAAVRGQGGPPHTAVSPVLARLLCMGSSNSAGASSAILCSLLQLEYNLDLGLLFWFLRFFLLIQSQYKYLISIVLPSSVLCLPMQCTINHTIEFAKLLSQCYVLILIMSSFMVNLCEQHLDI